MDMRILPSQNVDRITEDVEKALNDLDCGVKVKVEDYLGGAFQLEDEEFKQAAKKVLDELRQDKVEYITEGGASDGRFFSERGTPFIELGLNQESAHAENEYCDLEKLRKLRKAYYMIARDLAS
jgi:acetylornithine deacetylase/succinyl-diaminopimelate desuccinylase-like protein